MPSAKITQLVVARSLLSRQSLRDTHVEQIRQRSLFVIGTADPQYSRDGVVCAESATGGRTVVIDHANHSLETEGDVWKSLAVMERVLRAIDAFVNGR